MKRLVLGLAVFALYVFPPTPAAAQTRVPINTVLQNTDSTTLVVASSVRLDLEQNQLVSLSKDFCLGPFGLQSL
jgi:hypothetical protein